MNQVGTRKRRRRVDRVPTVDCEETVAALVLLVSDVETANGHVALLLAQHFADGLVEDAFDGGEFFGGARLEEGGVVMVSQAQAF